VVSSSLSARLPAQPSLGDFMDFRCSVNASISRFFSVLRDKVYGVRLIVDYSLGACWTAFALPTFEGQVHLVVVKIVSELGCDNVEVVVGDTVRSVHLPSGMACDSRTLIVFALKPSLAQALRVKANGVRGWMRAFKVKVDGVEWFVEPVFLSRRLGDVEGAVFSVLSRMLARFYGCRLFKLLDSMGINPAIYDHNPVKIYTSIYSNIVSVYRESVREFLLRTCKLIIECRGIISSLVRRAKAGFHVMEAARLLTSGAPRKVLGEAAKRIVNVIPILVSKVAESIAMEWRAEALLNGRYRVA